MECVMSTALKIGVFELQVGSTGPGVRHGLNEHPRIISKTPTPFF